MGKFYPAKYLRLIQILTSLCGLKPHKFPSKILTDAHKIYCNFTITICITFVLTEYYDSYQLLVIEKDVMALVDNLGVSLLYTSTILKIFVMRGKSFGNLMDRTDEMEKDFQKYQDEREKIYIRFVKYNKFIIKFLTFVYVITVTPYYFVAAIQDAKRTNAIYENVNGTLIYLPRPLPLTSWVPFDKYKYYWTTYIWQCYCVSIGGTLVYIADCLTYSMLIFPTMLLKILQDQFANFVDRAKATKSEDPEKEVEKSLGECIDFHKVIIKYVDDLNDTIRWLMFVDFGITGFQMTMVAFQSMTGTLDVKQFASIEYLMAMLTQLFLCYWNADDVYYESLKVADSVIEADWFDCDIKIKRSMILIMMRAQKPLKFTIGNLYNMSVQTAVSILRATYSFVTLLRNTI